MNVEVQYLFKSDNTKEVCRGHCRGGWSHRRPNAGGLKEVAAFAKKVVTDEIAREA
jgi:hypothetical protein